MSTRQGTLLIFHPTDGVLVHHEMFEREAFTKALEFAARHYPGTETRDKWMSGNWWLMTADDATDSEFPRPWPLAGYIPTSNVLATFGGQLPNWIGMIASNANSILTFPFTSEEEINAFAQRFVESGANLFEDIGGFTARWSPSKTSSPIVVGFGFKFAPDE